MTRVERIEVKLDTMLEYNRRVGLKIAHDLDLSPARAVIAAGDEMIAELRAELTGALGGVVAAIAKAEGSDKTCETCGVNGMKWGPDRGSCPQCGQYPNPAIAKAEGRA